MQTKADKGEIGFYGVPTFTFVAGLPSQLPSLQILHSTSQYCGTLTHALPSTVNLKLGTISYKSKTRDFKCLRPKHL